MYVLHFMLLVNAALGKEYCKEMSTQIWRPAIVLEAWSRAFWDPLPHKVELKMNRIKYILYEGMEPSRIDAS